MEEINKNCKHCNAQTHSNQEFCCSGCKIAYAFLHELNLQKYYQDVRQIFNSQPQTVEIYNQYNYDEHIDCNDQTRSITVHIPQVVCGACVWLIERTLQRQFQNLKISLNFANKALYLEWEENSLFNFNDILNIINKLGYNAIPITVDNAYNSAKHDERKMLRRIGIAGLCAFFTMMLSICIWAGHADGSMDILTKNLFYIISFAAVIPALYYSADIFFIRAWKSLKNNVLDFNLSISIAIVTTTLISIYTTFGNSLSSDFNSVGINYAYYDSAISLVFALLLGKYLEVKVKNKAIYDSSQRFKIENSKYCILSAAMNAQNDSSSFEEPYVIKYPMQINPNDEIIIKKGQTIPVDCILLSDMASLDTSILSGESIAQKFCENDRIKAGSINISSVIKVRAVRKYKESFLYKLHLEVEKSIASSKSSRIASRIANLFTPILLLCAVATFMYWYYFKGSGMLESLYITTTLLIITCPCAIGIAIPLSSFAVVTNLAKKDVIVKNPEVLEEFCNVKNIVFDKTGTLTTGELQIKLPQGMSQHNLNVLFTITGLSSHPFSASIHNSLMGCKRLKYQEIKEVLGKGLEIVIEDTSYLFGKASFVGVKPCESTIFFKTPNKIVKIEYVDKLRENAKNMVEFFRKRNIVPWIISGDNIENVEKIAQKIAVPKQNYFCNTSPQDKFKICSQIGDYAMIGDGLNDSIVLKSAKVSISHYDGADLSKYNSDIIFKGNNLAVLSTIFNAAKKFRQVVMQNFICSIIYNIVALPIAFFGYTTPLKAAIFMACSSICVTLNSLRIR